MKLPKLKKSSPKSTPNKQFYNVKEFPEPSSIPLEKEVENQKYKLGPTDSPYEAFRRANQSFGLSVDIGYTVKKGKLILQANAYSEKEALKMIEEPKQKEAIKKALGVEV